MNTDKPNPNYVNAPYECVGILDGVEFIISEHPPENQRMLWVRMPEKTPMIWSIRDDDWITIKMPKSWFKQLPFPPKPDDPTTDFIYHDMSGNIHKVPRCSLVTREQRVALAIMNRIREKIPVKYREDVHLDIQYELMVEFTPVPREN